MVSLSIDGQPAKMGNNADFVVGEKMARALTSLMRQYPDFKSPTSTADNAHLNTMQK